MTFLNYCTLLSQIPFGAYDQVSAGRFVFVDTAGICKSAPVNSPACNQPVHFARSVLGLAGTGALGFFRTMENFRGRLVNDTTVPADLSLKLQTDEFIAIDAALGSVTFDLGSPGFFTDCKNGNVFSIKRLDGNGANTVTLIATGTTIEGAPSITLAPGPISPGSFGEFIRVFWFSNINAWVVIG